MQIVSYTKVPVMNIKQEESRNSQNHVSSMFNATIEPVDSDMSMIPYNLA